MTHAVPFLEPSDVQHLTVVGMTNVSAELKWSKPEGNREFYLVTFINESKPVEQKCDSEECTITGLIPGTKYEFTVKAVVNKTFGGVPSRASDYTSKYPLYPSIQTMFLFIAANLKKACAQNWNIALNISK